MMAKLFATTDAKDIPDYKFAHLFGVSLSRVSEWRRGAYPACPIERIIEATRALNSGDELPSLGRGPSAPNPFGATEPPALPASPLPALPASELPALPASELMAAIEMLLSCLPTEMLLRETALRLQRKNEAINPSN